MKLKTGVKLKKGIKLRATVPTKPHEKYNAPLKKYATKKRSVA